MRLLILTTLGGCAPWSGAHRLETGLLATSAEPCPMIPVLFSTANAIRCPRGSHLESTKGPEDHDIEVQYTCRTRSGDARYANLVFTDGGVSERFYSFDGAGWLQLDYAPGELNQPVGVIVNGTSTALRMTCDAMRTFSVSASRGTDPPTADVTTWPDGSVAIANFMITPVEWRSMRLYFTNGELTVLGVDGARGREHTIWFRDWAPYCAQHPGTGVQEEGACDELPGRGNE